MTSKPRPVDVEVLPPEKDGNFSSDVLAPGANALPRLIAMFMDNLFKVPGTKLKFGINPLLDLIPGFGDAAAAVISSLTLYVASRAGVPKIILARMGLNILLNSAVGIIPGVGEAFAFWFRPSQRNYDLLTKYLAENGGKRTATTQDWLFVIGLIALVLIVFTSCVVAGAYLFIWLIHQIGKTR